MNHKILDKLGSFYFGAGGAGDLLLLLSTFYDSLTEPVNLIFWANNEKFIKEFVSLFPKIEKSIIFKGWPYNPKEDFGSIIQHHNFKGKGHIPDNLAYIKEWNTNWKKYRKDIKIPFEYLRSFNFKFSKNNFKYIGLAFWGSTQDTWKIKSLNHDELKQVMYSIQLAYQNEPHKLIVFGSQQDKDNNTIEPTKNLIDVRGLSLKEQFGFLGLCDEFIGTDTWFKTYTALLNIPTTVYKNRYAEKDLTHRFNVNHDPGDFIFLENWQQIKLIEAKF